MKRAPSNLPDVVKEICSLLLAGDWSRFADDTGERFYYVVGEESRGKEVAARASWEMEIFEHFEPGQFEDWHVKAALAQEPADRLKQARKCVEAEGIDARLFDRAIDEVCAADGDDEYRRVAERWIAQFVDASPVALCAFLGAVVIERVRNGRRFVTQADRAGLRKALERRFLKELAERYPKVVERASTLVWLSLSDPSLREASRCFLYGFFRATVLISASAVELRLRECGGPQVARAQSYYEELVASVFGRAGTYREDKVRSAALKDLFRMRNRVAHEGAEARREEAERALLLARESLEVLSEPPGAGV